jgi:putative acetyltransferase
MHLIYFQKLNGLLLLITYLVNESYFLKPYKRFLPSISLIHEQGRPMQTYLLHHPTTEQLDQLMTIWLHGNLKAHPFIKADYWRKQAPAVRTALPQAQLIIATTAEKIVGFIGLQGHYVAGIFVQAGAQQQGVGTALLAAAKELTHKLQLSVYVANRPAVAFYHHSGFHVHEQQIDKATNQPEYTMRWHR